MKNKNKPLSQQMRDFAKELKGEKKSTITKSLSNGTPIEVETDDGDISIMAPVRVSSPITDGEHLLSDGRAVVCIGGVIRRIIPAAANEQEARVNARRRKFAADKASKSNKSYSSLYKRSRVVKALVTKLYLKDGRLIEVSTEGEEIAIGDSVTVNGESIENGEHMLADDRTIITASGDIVEIKPSEIQARIAARRERIKSAKK